MLYNIGLSLERLGRWSEAVEAHERFLSEVPEDHADAEESRQRLERARVRAERMGADDHVDVDPVPVSDPDPNPSPVVHAGDGPRLLPWMVMGASAVVGVVALGIGVRAHAIHGDLETACPTGVCSPNQQDDIDRGQALARTSTALTSIAAAGATTGVVLFFVGGDDEDEGRAHLEVAPTRGGGYVQGRVPF